MRINTTTLLSYFWAINISFSYRVCLRDSDATPTLASIKRCFVTNSLIPSPSPVLNLPGKRTRAARVFIYHSFSNLNKIFLNALNILSHFKAFHLPLKYSLRCRYKIMQSGLFNFCHDKKPFFLKKSRCIHPRCIEGRSTYKIKKYKWRRTGSFIKFQICITSCRWLQFQIWNGPMIPLLISAWLRSFQNRIEINPKLCSFLKGFYFCLWFL